MAISAEPATDALYRALSSPTRDPHVVHTAIEEIRYLSGHNVITEMKAEFTKVNARIDALESRIDVLQRVIWPLIGLLYRVVIATPS